MALSSYKIKKILRLDSEHKSYRYIKDDVKCSLGSVSKYIHFGENPPIKKNFKTNRKRNLCPEAVSSEPDGSSQEYLDKDEIIKEATDQNLIILNPILNEISCLKQQINQVSQDIQRIKQEHVKEQKEQGIKLQEKDKKIEELESKIQELVENQQKLNRKYQDFEIEKQIDQKRITNLENQNQKLIEIVDILQHNNKNNYQFQLNLSKQLDLLIHDKLTNNTDFDPLQKKIVLSNPNHEYLETQKEKPQPEIQTKTNTNNIPSIQPSNEKSIGYESAGIAKGISISIKDINDQFFNNKSSQQNNTTYTTPPPKSSQVLY